MDSTEMLDRMFASAYYDKATDRHVLDVHDASRIALDAARTADPGERCCVESGCPHGFVVGGSDKPGPYVGTSLDRVRELEDELAARTADPGGLREALAEMERLAAFRNGITSSAYGYCATLLRAALTPSPTAPERTGLDEAAEAIGRDVLAMFNATTNGERNRALERALAGLRALTSAPTTDFNLTRRLRVAILDT